MCEACKKNVVKDLKGIQAVPKSDDSDKRLGSSGKDRMRFLNTEK